MFKILRCYEVSGVMQGLSGMDVIVVDVRFNGGGQGAVSFEILSRFASEERIRVAGRQVCHKGGYTGVQSLCLEGRNDAFSGGVYVLALPQTASAAETFVIVSKALDNVRVIGLATSGAMSSALEEKAP